MFNGIRGDGIGRVHAALQEFADDPDQLDNARMRLHDGLPPFTSRTSPSSTSTRIQSPNAPSKEQKLQEEQQWKLRRDRAASLPNEQFEAQVHEETERIIRAVELGTLVVPVGKDYSKVACENIRHCWIGQGIWKDEWDSAPNGLWKHEEPSTPRPASGPLTKTSPRSRLFSDMQGADPPSTLSTNAQARESPQRNAVSTHEREASRPFYQFISQLSRERERIQDESKFGNVATSVPANINTVAYENVKNTWVRRGIWDKRWGIFPGMSWKHEWPLEALLKKDSAAAEGKPPEDTHDAAMMASILQPSPPAGLRDSFPISAAEQALDPPVTGNDNAYFLRSIQPSRQRNGRSVRQKPRKSRREGSAEVVLSRVTGNGSLGPIKPSRVGKPTRKEQRGQRKGRGTSGKICSNPKPVGIQPRRSQRLQNKVNLS